PKESVSPTVFLPLGGSVFQNLPERIIVSGRAPVLRLEAATNQELSSAFPGLAVVGTYQVEDRLRGLLIEEQRRVLLALAGSTGVAFIAYIGLYSALIYFITTKRRELAIRICCGATRGKVFRIVMWNAGRSGIGAVIIS